MTGHDTDPALASARREALVVLVAWLCALTYTIGYCVRYGYGRADRELAFVWGLPDWVFWGIVVPWGVCLLFSYGFAYHFMTDADLGRDPDEPDDPLAGTGGRDQV